LKTVTYFIQEAALMGIIKKEKTECLEIVLEKPDPIQPLEIFVKIL